MADLSTRVPEPALVRGFLVALVGVLAVVLGKTIDTAWVDLVVQTYTLAAPLLAGLLIRRAVWPVDPNQPRL